LRVPPHAEPVSRPVQSLLALEPQYRERVWGGDRLRRSDPPIGEAWIAFGESRVTSGPAAGSTIDQLATGHGPALLGDPVVERFGERFPLIVKLLDTADWLSVQVHPDDAQARAMVGPNENGKTEAWYFIEAPSAARILAGVRPGVTGPELATAIRSGRVLEVATEVPVEAGSSILIPSGTLHSLGPGLLVCEVQQASDITFRTWDWNRPQSGGRRLHVEESIAVMRTVGPCERHRPTSGHRTGVARAESCRYFEMELATVAAGEPLEADTTGASFHALTAIDGAVEIECGTETLRLGRFETAIVAAAAGRYRVTSSGRFANLLRASVPGARQG
jgi:mannose-6-phosphate isomerase